MDPTPGTELGKYTVVRPLGAGGMGVVVLARHRELGSLHAIKLLRAEGPEVDDRLRQEGRLQANLSHPNVVKVTDTVDVQGRSGLVMEYVDGPTLAEFASAHRPLSFVEVDKLARGILRGVAEAHDQGWIHRDIKPGNILLQITKDEIVPKVADFGLAKVLAGDGPGAADMGDTSRYGLGTRGYMPLEQLVGLKPDARMDVFALGAVLYELAIGRPAFPTVEAWEAAIRNGSYPDPVREGLPTRMRDAIRASLAERATRPATARELLALWIGTEDSDAPGFRASALRPGRRPEDHLGRDRLVSDSLSATERSHLEWCVRCRSEARLARAYLDPEHDPDLLEVEEPSPATLTPSAIANLRPPTSSSELAQDVGRPDALAEPTRPPARRGLWVLVPLVIAAIAVPIPFLLADGGATPPSPPEPVPVSAPTPAPVVVQPAALAVPAPPPPPPPMVRPQARPAVAPVGTATLIVNTVGGPAGRFQVDEGPLLTVGPLRKQRVPAGRHHVRIFPHGNDEPAWEGDLTLRPDAEEVLCWDLAARASCAQ